MTIKNFKEFVKDHKKEIIVISGCVLVGGVVFAITRKKPKLDSNVMLKNLQSKDEDVRILLDYLSITDKIKEESGATMYVPANADEIKSLLGDIKGVTDPNGITLDVTGAILFGKPVENKT